MLVATTGLQEDLLGAGPSCLIGPAASSLSMAPIRPEWTPSLVGFFVWSLGLGSCPVQDTRTLSGP